MEWKLYNDKIKFGRIEKTNEQQNNKHNTYSEIGIYKVKQI